MFSESTTTLPAPVQPVIENGAGKHVPHYRVEVDAENMTWGDNMIHIRFQLLIELASGMGEATPAERVQAYKDLIAGFEELTAFLDRVAEVYRDGVLCPTIRDVPHRFVQEIMAAIGKAKANEAATKN